MDPQLPHDGRSGTGPSDAAMPPGPPGAPSARETEALLEQLGWMRRLARTLVGDAAAADDLAQDACVAALEHRPDASLPLRGWLATVLRNGSRERQRGSERRRNREEDCARDERQDSALETLARVATQRELTSAVLELDEPFRTAILLRYFEELPPRRIARRLGVPVATVKSRLTRGLAQLRGRLQVEPGGDPERIRALAAVAFWPRLSPAPAGAAPLAEPLGTKAAATIGALAVSTQAKILLAAASLVAGFFLVRSVTSPEPAEAGAATPQLADPVAAAESERPPAPAPTPEPVRRAETVPDEPVSSPAVAAATEVAEPETAALATIRGRVLDVNGAGLANLEVLAGTGESPAPVARTDGAGRFVWDGATRGAALRVEDEVWTTVLAGSAVARAEPIVVVAPRVAHGGWVVDADGNWLADARVRFALPEDFRSRFSEILDFSSEVQHLVESDANGRFELPNAPAVEGARLIALHERFPAEELAAPLAPSPNLTFVLGQDEPLLSAVRGRVLDAAGDPVEGARVSLAFETTLTDAAGEFELPLGDRTANASARRFVNVVPDTLIAAKAGSRPARAVTEARDAEGQSLWAPYVVLRLAGPPLTVAGRVVDEAGEPRAGARVWIADPTFFGVTPNARGGTDELLLENAIAGRPTESWLSVVADSEGRFELTGLEERDYRIEAMDDATLRRAVVRDVAAGDRSVRIVLPRGDLFARVRGHVVTEGGQPVPGARVSPMCDSFQVAYDGHPFSTRHSRSGGVLTDEDGAFELEDVPRDLVYLRVDSESTLSIEYGRGHAGGLADLTEGDVDDVVLRVPARLHFQVELAGTEPRRIAAFDGEGERLTLYLFQGNSNRSQSAVDLEPGRSPTLAVSEAVRELAVYADEEEIARRPVQLVFGEITTVEL